MILRRWRGAVRPEDAERYLEHQARTGVRDYRDTPGNLGALALSRPRGELVEVVTLSLWESMDAVRRFAGEDPERARFFSGDDDLLVEKDLHVDHFEVAGVELDARLGAPPTG
jgi:heme-degrading monooxygenase HmoA